MGVRDSLTTRKDAFRATQGRYERSRLGLQSTPNPREMPPKRGAVAGMMDVTFPVLSPFLFSPFLFHLCSCLCSCVTFCSCLAYLSQDDRSERRYEQRPRGPALGRRLAKAFRQRGMQRRSCTLGCKPDRKFG